MLMPMYLMFGSEFVSEYTNLFVDELHVRQLFNAFFAVVYKM